MSLRVSILQPVAGSLLLVSCAGSISSTPSTALSSQVAVDDLAIIERSHAVLAAYDHADRGQLEVMLGKSFVHVDGTSTSTREEDLAVSSAVTVIGKRVWSQETVATSPNVRIFRGFAEEEQVGNEVHGNYRFRGWYTLVWSYEADAWRLAFLTWQMPAYDDENTWNSIYKNRVGFNHEPNQLLAAAVSGVTPGRALDVAAGQGRNALYLASLGWKVTAVDIALEGLRQARENASAKKLDFESVYADGDTYDYGVDKWNLVTMIYTPKHRDWIEKIKPSIARGGLFVLELFAATEANPGNLSLAELEQRFAGWELIKHEVVEDTPDWQRNRDKLLRFIARRP